MATNTPNSSDSDSGENKKPEETNPSRQPRISLRKLSSAKPKPPPAESAEVAPEKAPEAPADPPEEAKEKTEPPKPPGRKPRHLGKPPVKADEDQEKASVPEETAKKAPSAPARKPRHFRMHPTEKEGKKKSSAKKKGSRRRALALPAILAAVSTAFLLPQNPYSPFSGSEAASAAEERTETADSTGTEPSAAQPLPGGENKAAGPVSQPVDAAVQADSDEAVNSVADVLGRLRTVPLHLSTKPEGLFIDRVFYPLDSVIDPGTGLRLISVQPDIRRPVAVFLTPDGEPHSLPLPEKGR